MRVPSADREHHRAAAEDDAIRRIVHARRLKPSVSGADKFLSVLLR